MRISVPGSVACEGLTPGPGEQVLLGLSGGAGGGPGPRGWTGELRGAARSLTSIPSSGGEAGWASRNDIGRSANQARGCFRAATSAKRWRPRGRAPQPVGREGGMRTHGPRAHQPRTPPFPFSAPSRLQQIAGSTGLLGKTGNKDGGPCLAGRSLCIRGSCWAELRDPGGWARRT